MKQATLLILNAIAVPHEVTKEEAWRSTVVRKDDFCRSDG
jgi:hypothetical protein